MIYIEFCQIMIQKEEIPSEFRKPTLHMIYKGKGKRQDLSKNRFIHSKSWFIYLQLLEEQRILEENETRRDEERRRRIEEAKMEEMKLEEELK